MRKKTLELQVIVDFIIQVKKKRFNEEFTTLYEVNIIKQLIEKRFERKGVNVEIVDVISKKNFNVVNEIITKSNNFSYNLKEIISNEMIREIIYDENFIYLCLCEIIIDKLNNSIEHTCLTCSNECCGRLKKFSEGECSRWTYDFRKETQKRLRKIL